MSFFDVLRHSKRINIRNWKKKFFCTSEAFSMRKQKIANSSIWVINLQKWACGIWYMQYYRHTHTHTHNLNRYYYTLVSLDVLGIFFHELFYKLFSSSVCFWQRQCLGESPLVAHKRYFLESASGFSFFVRRRTLTHPRGFFVLL